MLALVLGALSANGQALSDFGIPASSDGPAQLRQVEAPAEVKVTENAALGQKVISAASTQDAINSAVQDLVESGEGARFIATASGVGVVASGAASYGADGKNPNLVLIEQRRAYIDAMIEAKVEMARLLNGLTVAGKQFLYRQTQLRDTPEAALANIEAGSSEQISESIAGVLRGVVVYDLEDNPNEGLVRVSLVTSPKTQGAVQYLGRDQISAGTLEAGMAYVFNEIRAGLIPPEGGRVITVPETGEVAWVAFGSEICRKNSDREIQRILKSEAQHTAGTRAQRALLSIINGESVTGDSTFGEVFEKQKRQFEVIQDEAGKEEIRALAQQQSVSTATCSACRSQPATGRGPESVFLQGRELGLCCGHLPGFGHGGGQVSSSHHEAAQSASCGGPSPVVQGQSGWLVPD